MAYYDPKFTSKQLVIRYVIGGQEREAKVLSNGHSVEEHVDRIEALLEGKVIPANHKYVPWPLVHGGTVAIRLDTIVAIEVPEFTS